MRTNLRAMRTLLLGIIAISTSLAYAADCDALKKLRLEKTTITMAQRIASGAADGPGLSAPVMGLPAFCRVMGVMRPTSDSEIRFEVWLPESGWNGRFLGVGNGGFAGSIYYQQMAGYLQRGFATAGSDAGHQADAEDASWAFGHPEKVKDFGWRAVHLTAERAKSIIAAYYRQPLTKSYFDACSDGGREALMEAQRFPQDYDGILAGAPANNWAHMVSSGVNVAQVVRGEPQSYISSLKLPAIQRASLAACDAGDGVKDGFISDPVKCHFDPGVLLCKGGESTECLTPPQVRSLKKLYQGGVDSQGKSIFPGFMPGDETSWSKWVVGAGPGSASGDGYTRNYFSYMVSGDPKWNVLTANVDASLKQAEAKTGADVDSTDPDLGKFAARGGKLIVYHGWNDQAISPWNSIHYHESVQKAMGAQKAESMVRLYMAPGVEHCASGPGPSAFGQLGIPTTGEAKYGIFDSLVDWVEKSTPPGSIVATKYEGQKAVMTRPLCAYPQVAKYKGIGDKNDAANFSCVSE